MGLDVLNFRGNFSAKNNKYPYDLYGYGFLKFVVNYLR